MKFDRLRLAFWDASHQVPLHKSTLTEYQYAFTDTFDISRDDDAVTALSMLYMARTFVRAAILYSLNGDERDVLEALRKEIDAVVSLIYDATLALSGAT